MGVDAAQAGQHRRACWTRQPPPLPAHPIPPSSWKLPNPLVFTSWGWRTDGDFINVEVIGRRMEEARVGTVALQIGLFGADVPARLRAFGFKIALWGEPDSRDAEALAHAEADGYLPQIEGPSQYESALNNLKTGVGAGMSRAVVCTVWSFDTWTSRPDGTADGESTTVEVEGLVEAGVTMAYVECYTGDMRPSIGARGDVRGRPQGLPPRLADGGTRQTRRVLDGRLRRGPLRKAGRGVPGRAHERSRLGCSQGAVVGLQEAIQNIWASDYVQRNPNRAYRTTYAAEYAKVAEFLNGGPEPDWSGFSRLGKGLCEAEVERRKATDPGPEPPPNWYPSTWQLTGPLGGKVPLPVRKGAFLILWPGQPGGPTTWEQFKARVALREQQWGRKPDAIMVTDDPSVWPENRLAWIRDYGCLPIAAGLNFGGHDGVLNGSQNANIDAVANRYKALGVTVMIRLHHEFNYSHLVYTSVGQEAKFIASWKYIVNRFKAAGAVNVGFWFCPAEGGDTQARTSADTCFVGLSPAFIDWVGTDTYNHCYVGENGCYSSPYTAGYSDFPALFDYPNTSRHAKWGPVKPFVIGETGTVFDPNNPTRKAQWLRSVAPGARNMEYLAGIGFFDIDATAWEGPRNNWILDHPVSVPEIKAAMIEMAQDPWLNAG